MFGRKKNENVAVRGEDVEAVRCQVSGDDAFVTFVMKGGREVTLDEKALEKQSAGMAAHIAMAAGGLNNFEGTSDELRAKLQAAYDEHCRTCANCAAKQAKRAQA